eukprot:TRINITY_DN1698_c0_g2_i1.p1 TRINITY_DN1698_c0_g2~~TRINITY_DN1698_c0_g2_i1.p1  ORF type:complete len:979 (-),score=356.91 TRINITY_DN1698_c0_g2_i1:1765-4701(-)
MGGDSHQEGGGDSGEKMDEVMTALPEEASASTTTKATQSKSTTNNNNNNSKMIIQDDDEENSESATATQKKQESKTEEDTSATSAVKMEFEPLVTSSEDIRILRKACDNVGAFYDETQGGLGLVVRMALDTSFLDKYVAKQWGVSKKKPIILQLKFDPNYLMSAEIPSLFLYQSSDDKLDTPTLTDYETEFGVIQWFLETRLTSVLRKNWFNKPKKYLLDPVQDDGAANAAVAAGASSSSSASSSVTPQQPTIEVSKDDVNSLVNMGFTEQQARQALVQCSGDINKALEMLLGGGGTGGDGSSDVQIIGETKKDNKANNTSDQQSQQQEIAEEAKSASDDEFKVKELVTMGFSEEQAKKALSRAHSLGTALDLLVSGVDLDDIKLDTTNNNNNAPKPNQAAVDQSKKEKEDKDKEKIEILTALGASKEHAKGALEIYNGDLKKASEFLMEQMEETRKYEKSPKKRQPVHRRGFYNNHYEDDEEDEEDEEEDEESERVVEVDRRKRRRNEKKEEPERESPLETTTFSGDRENFWLGENNKDDCFLLRLYNYAKERFLTCTSHCLICDKELDITSMVRLPVCGREACAKTYATSGACAASNAVTREIKTNPKVVDLLINLLLSATVPANKGWNRNGNGLPESVTSYRHNRGYLHQQNAPQSFEPFPWGLGFDDGRIQNIQKLQKTCDLIPSISSMQIYSTDEQLKVALDDISPEVFPLLRWIVCSSRPHLTCLPKRKEFVKMKPALQFQMVTSSPEHEEKFLEWKRMAQINARVKGQRPNEYNDQYNGGRRRVNVHWYNNQLNQDDGTENSKGRNGSFVAFHGSPISNWHSIIRTGLRSGHVPGIYMAQNKMTSIGYMAGSTARPWRNTALGITEAMCAMSLVEVADYRDDQKKITGGRGSQTVNVVNDKSLVVTRFLFVWPKGMQVNPLTWGGFGYTQNNENNVLANDLLKEISNNMFVDVSEDPDQEEGDTDVDEDVL